MDHRDSLSRFKIPVELSKSCRGTPCIRKLPGANKIETPLDPIGHQGPGAQQFRIGLTMNCLAKAIHDIKQSIAMICYIYIISVQILLHCSITVSCVYMEHTAIE